tara:strand:- start:866 stop:1582 length:717 start_codon:yes stop_codon:yes gene_type:complete
MSNGNDDENVEVTTTTVGGDDAHAVLDAEFEARLVALEDQTITYDPWEQYTTIPSDVIIIRSDDYLEPDITIGDIYEIYNNLSEEERRAVDEKMLSQGYYAYGSKDLSNLESPANGFYALWNATKYYATQGVTPFDGLPDANPDDLIPEAPVVSSATEAQINVLADSAAGNLLGRNATAEERQLAMSVVRELEASAPTTGMRPSQADIEAAFAGSAPQEAALRGSEKALSVFESIVGR